MPKILLPYLDLLVRAAVLSAALYIPVQAVKPWIVKRTPNPWVPRLLAVLLGALVGLGLFDNGLTWRAVIGALAGALNTATYAALRAQARARLGVVLPGGDSVAGVPAVSRPPGEGA